MKNATTTLLLFISASMVTACIGPGPEGIARSNGASTTVKLDLFHKPLPEIPLPNDLATRHDPTSATGLRINASMIAATTFESHVRRLVDQLDGWGIFQHISIPFSGPLDVQSIRSVHRDADYDLSDDVVYLINVDPDSPEFGRLHHLDMGNGNYPLVLQKLDKYGKNDPRRWTLSLLFEEADEDENGNGRLDPGEDTDADGVLDKPNYLACTPPAREDLAGRADALMTFYERQTNTLIFKPLVPLNERTTYAVVVTRRLKDTDGEPVGSPYPYIHHASQTRALEPLAEVLPPGLELEDVAFAFSFTTQSTLAHFTAVRDGLYGHGVQAHLAEEFPAQLNSLEKLKDPQAFPSMKNPYILHPEHFLDTFQSVATMLVGDDFGSEAVDRIREDQQYVDFHVIGSIKSPQLFARTDAEGNPLPLNDQSWPPDLDRVRVPTREETIYFWITVPRKEISVRGQGKPAPLLITSHGFKSSRAEGVIYGSYMARFGFATFGIDTPSHGLGISPFQIEVAKVVAADQGLSAFAEALFKDRATDQNGDGIKDAGGDFMTAYMFHTRDMFRQTVLDHMQAIRILRSFDGKQRWTFDVNGDGQSELAGDFDGDGVVDIDGTAPMAMTGVSLGGLITLLVGALEPSVRTAVPISGAGGLGDIGIRSRVGGIPEAYLLRVMGPNVVGTLNPESNEMLLEQLIPNLLDEEEVPFASISGVEPGDTMVLENLVNSERGCGVVSKEGTVRAAVAADLEDPMRVIFYSGYVIAGEDCKLTSVASPKVTVDSFENDALFMGRSYKQGQPLVALAEGLGLRRASPDLRRFTAFGSLVLDPGDPGSYARHLLQQPWTYPGTQETTGASTLLVAGAGDMSVTVASTIAGARAAGILDYLHSDPRYGKSLNQVLIDTYAVEGVGEIKRFTDASGAGMVMDVDNLSQGTDPWGATIPRLDPPLRIGSRKKDARGGRSGVLFPFSDPAGAHVFDLPGMMTDKARQACDNKCKANIGADPCGCNALSTFDIGVFMINVTGRYMASGGKQLSLDLCNSSDSCADRTPPPEQRPNDQLD